MTRRKRNKKRDFPAAWRRYDDFDKALKRVGATMAEFNEWMKDPAFVERWEEAVMNVPPYASPRGLLLLAKELPFSKWYDHAYATAKHAAALPEKEREAFCQRLGNSALRKKVEALVKQCLSGRFKPGFHSKKDEQIAELICDTSLTDSERATKAGMTLGAFKMRKSAWMKNIASLKSSVPVRVIRFTKSKKKR